MGFRDMDALLQSFVENGPAGCGCAIARKGEILYDGNCLLRRIPCTDSIR